MEPCLCSREERSHLLCMQDKGERLNFYFVFGSQDLEWVENYEASKTNQQLRAAGPADLSSILEPT